MNKKIVTITRVTENSVTMSDGLSADIRNFPGAKVGQTWEVTVDESRPFVTGDIIQAKLKEEAT
jgi:hypothetical protein